MTRDICSFFTAHGVRVCALFMWQVLRFSHQPVRTLRTENRPMLDLIYILATVAFFALALASVAACEHRGRPAVADVPMDSARTNGKTP